MSEQKKPKIDLKARLGKKTVAGPGGPAIPPPVGIPKPPVMSGGMGLPGGVSPSQPPPRQSNPYVASNPYAAPSSPYGGSSPYAAAEPAPPQRMEPQSITVEMSEEVIEQQKKIARRGYVMTAIISVIIGGMGFAFGGRAESGKGAKAALEGARDLVTDVTAADKVADDLNDVLAKASERLGKNEYPEEEIAKLGAINIPFDGGHLTDKGIGRFNRAVVTQLFAYASTAQKANEQKEKIQNLLTGSKAALTDLLQQKTDPKIRWSVVVESGPGGPWASMQPLPAPFLVKSDQKVKDKDGKETDYAWLPEITVPRGNAQATVKRYKSGDISSGDPQFVPVNPATESMVCPSSTIVRIRTELSEMQTILKGDQTPGNEKTGLLQMGDSVTQALKKLLQS
jgi:hypothetical protein